jgi:hypothetical protein
MMSAERAARPFGIAGEVITSNRVDPLPPAPQPFSPPPPDWEEEARLRAERGDVEPEARPGALAELKADEEREPPAFMRGPPLVLPPLERPVFDPPDWRDEELERERQRTAGVEAEQLEPVKSLQERPA